MIKKTVAALTAAAMVMSGAVFAEEAKSISENDGLVLMSEVQESAQTPEITVKKSGSSYEFEEFFDWAKYYLTDDENASGGKCVRSGAVGSDIPLTGYSRELKVNVVDEGYYSVHFLTQMIRENLSTVKVTLDGVEFVDNSNGTSSKHFSTAIPAVAQSTGSNWIEDFYIDTELTAGEHSLVVSIERLGKTSNAVAFDTIYFYQPKEYTDVSVDYEPYASSGDEIQISVLDQDGEAINKRNYESIEFTTETPDVISISGGKVYARNQGRGLIKMVLNTGSKEFTEDIVVEVAANNGLIIKSVKPDGGRVLVNLYAIKNYTAQENLTLVSYNLVRGIKSLFLKTSTQKIPEITAGEEKSVEFDISEWEAFGQLSLFMHKNALGQNFSIISFVSDVK